MRIILLGAPGAGKGTQCKRIVDKYSLVHLSSGDILRQERAAGTELGKKAQSYMDSGGLVPDTLIVEMMAGAIKKVAAKGFVLDGFPRTINQAQELDKALNASGQRIDAVINLVIDDSIILNRMTGRRSCPKCGAVYHIENLKPKIDGVCDKEGTKLAQRPDDTLDVVKTRLKTYHDQTKPVVGYYKSQNSVHDIKADMDVDTVTSLVLKTLESITK
jgi:adenylate kinase